MFGKIVAWYRKVQREKEEARMRIFCIQHNISMDTLKKSLNRISTGNTALQLIN